MGTSFLKVCVRELLYFFETAFWSVLVLDVCASFLANLRCIHLSITPTKQLALDSRVAALAARTPLVVVS
jgi:hypothetical protein